MNQSLSGMSGIAGWLKFYINWSLFIFPLTLVLVVLGVFWQFNTHSLNLPAIDNPVFHHYFWVTLPAFFIVICWRAVATFKLYDEHIAETIREMKFCLLFYPFIFFLIELFFVQVEQDLGNSVSYLGMWVFFAFLAEAMVWYWYFNASLRVRYTYEEISRVEPVLQKLVPSSVLTRLEKHIIDNFDEIKEQVLENKTLEEIYQGFFNAGEKELFSFIEFKTVCRKLYYQDKT
jgi:hypothetical protein